MKVHGNELKQQGGFKKNDNPPQKNQTSHKIQAVQNLIPKPVMTQFECPEPIFPPQY